MSNKVSFKLQLNFPSYNLCFIEIERRAIMVKKSFKRKRQLSGGYDRGNTSSECLPQ